MAPIFSKFLPMSLKGAEAPAVQARSRAGTLDLRKTDNFLTNLMAYVTVFQKRNDTGWIALLVDISGRPGGALLGGWSRGVANLAKRKRSQAIENKRSREMTHFAPMNDLKDLRPSRETLSFRLAK
jgi:hypothetical protein